MPVPDFQHITLPMLEVLADGRERRIPELRDAIAERMGINEEDRAIRTPSGRHLAWNSRVAWAKVYLKMAGLIDNSKRGIARITSAGSEVLAKKPTIVDVRFLKQFPSMREFLERSRQRAEGHGEGGEEAESEAGEEPAGSGAVALTPQEMIEAGYQSLQRAVTDELLDRLKSCSPAFFEHVVVEVLRAMGYGGVEGDAQVTGKPGDGGIDGVIKEDKLGLDVVCLQAKRWEGVVGRPIVQQFVGSLDLYRARKGVIITTSTFTRDAIDFVERIEGKKVVLIDGVTLAGLMLAYDVGVTTTSTYKIKEVSNDFFDEEEV